MKKLLISITEAEILRVPLESGAPGQVATFKDLRIIDKLVTILEEVANKAASNGNDTIEVELEDTDYQFMISRFEHFSSWNPGNQNLRKLVIGIADKVGIS